MLTGLLLLGTGILFWEKTALETFLVFRMSECNSRKKDFAYGYSLPKLSH